MNDHSANSVSVIVVMCLRKYSKADRLEHVMNRAANAGLKDRVQKREASRNLPCKANVERGFASLFFASQFFFLTCRHVKPGATLHTKLCSRTNIITQACHLHFTTTVHWRGLSVAYHKQ